MSILVYTYQIRILKVIRWGKNKHTEAQSTTIMPFCINAATIEMVLTVPIFQKEYQTDQGLYCSPCALNQNVQELLHAYTSRHVAIDQTRLFSELVSPHLYGEQLLRTVLYGESA